MFPLKKKPAIPATTPPATAPPATAPTASYASVAASVADPPPAQTAEPVGEEAPDLIGGVPSSQIPTGYQQAIHRAAAGGGKFEKVVGKLKHYYIKVRPGKSPVHTSSWNTQDRSQIVSVVAVGVTGREHVFHMFEDGSNTGSRFERPS